MSTDDTNTRKKTANPSTSTDLAIVVNGPLEVTSCQRTNDVVSAPTPAPIDTVA